MEEIMPVATDSLTPSPKAIQELRTCLYRIGSLASAQRLWDRHLTPSDRERLGGNLLRAHRKHDTFGLWSELRGITPDRAVVEVGQKLGFIRDVDVDWLLGEFGETRDGEEAMKGAIDDEGMSHRETARQLQREGHKFNSGNVWYSYYRWYEMQGIPAPKVPYNNGKKRRSA
jgi:hypothetical protein